MKRSIMFWIPRGILMLLGLFTMLFSLDVFGSKAPIGVMLLGFLIHNIPLIFILVLLWISHSQPVVSGIFSLLMMLGFAYIIRSSGNWWVYVLFMLPLLIAGCMLIYEHISAGKSIDEEI